MVEGGETRQVTPVPSEQVEEMEMDYDEGLVDDSDRQPVDLEEAIERNRRRIEEEEEVSPFFHSQACSRKMYFVR